MGYFDNLFRSKAQKDEDLKNYVEWAYPYGEVHKQKITDLILALVKEDDKQFAVYNYLITRQKLAPETYEGKYVVKDEQFIEVTKKLKKEYISKGKKFMHKYMALVEADLQIDENFNYPSIEELETRANEIKKIIEK